METFDFDGRVAVVTGAGRGIGRAHALLLALRGAKVVVNDLGGNTLGEGSDTGPARSVVDEITAAGGTAVADGNDVSTPEGGQAIVDRAVTEFGRIDVLVNNAGNVRFAGIADADAALLDSVYGVHVRGSFNTVHAAWPHFVEQGYGRIVFTTSHGLFGSPDNLAYATAKAGVIGLARAIKVNAGTQDIKINLIAPAAVTRLAGKDPDGEAPPAPADMDPDLVSPMVAYLAHENCPVSGEVYAAGMGRCTRVFIAETEGWVHTGGTRLTVEDIAANWKAINDESSYHIPVDLHGWTASFLSHRKLA
ncbi:NAD(P)-dependent dehydrogenase (short-subunit alcohol dehydrogenase family) [Prauserella sediminis]|uniref:NAD(P)-dependent dehydrogenase (Short-subunit alcohol dehydrogenase family) n=1 Tax=Prauserella sediminis TaxID=577680 RepID=A0A839XQK5_9PSEU|nr:SDR family NAD(P)-dependent oxidoreductase [Prauserella sediminis]MBB3665500.1 NAD(P)-dependent dehydrogenase (short-subunit alcohol dehydrogenase family) [Prauserella sediminis]